MDLCNEVVRVPSSRLHLQTQVRASPATMKSRGQRAEGELADRITTLLYSQLGKMGNKPFEGCRS